MNKVPDLNQPTPASTDASETLVEREIAAEQAHVDTVYQHLSEAAASARRVQDEGRSRFRTDRANFLREEDGTAIFERDAFAFQSARRLASLDAEHEGLVFGRLDLRTEETRYIGRLGVRDDEFEPLVIDWRAPAAEPFYRATPSSPMDVVRRRVLRSRFEKVIGIEDDLLDGSVDSDLVVVGEGALMAALKRARGHQMRDIVATIQAEQDEAIRAPYQGVTVIAGGPGTGKTVVALHRAAYLLYSNRRRMERGGVLVVGPSATFMNYIERVLPSLGEDAVTLRSMGALALDVLDTTAERVDSVAAAEIKGSLRILPVLRRAVDEPLVTAGEARSLRVSVKGDILGLDSQRLDRIRRDVLSGHRVNLGRPAAETALLNALWVQFDAEAHEMDRETFDDLVTSQASWQMLLMAWWPSLSANRVLERLADRGLLDVVAPKLTTEERDVVAASFGDPGHSVADIALLDELVHIIGPEFTEEDVEPELFLEGMRDVSEVVTLADRLSTQRENDPDHEAHSTFAHVLVDEAQDISPMQWRMLRRRGPQASWTLVGDPAQSSWAHAAETAQAIRELIGSGPSRRFRLSTNYRSPAEVFNVAASLITSVFPTADLPAAVRTTGIEPELLSTTSDGLVTTLNETVDRLAGQVDGTIGVICPPSLREQLAGQSDALTALTRHADRATVITPLQSKGLEYDGVIVVSPDDIIAESPGGARMLYVALTRPTQRLVTIDVTNDAPAAWRRFLE